MADNETTNKHVLLSDEEISALVSDAVQRGVHEGLLRVGIDTTDPIQLQRDFQFVRDLRKTADSIKSRALLTAVGIIVVGTITIAWLGIRTIFKTP